MKTIYLINLLFLFTIWQATAQDKTIQLRIAEGKISLVKGGKSAVISSLPQDSLAVLHKDYVYYIHNTISKEGRLAGALISYNVNSAIKQNILEGLTGIPGGISNAKIVQLYLDAPRERLFYTIKTSEEKGVPSYVSLVYSLKEKTVAEYKDGIIESIDANGQQTLVFYGIDLKGAYKTKYIYAVDGSLVQSFDDEYLNKF